MCFKSIIHIKSKFQPSIRNVIGRFFNEIQVNVDLIFKCVKIMNIYSAFIFFIALKYGLLAKRCR